jgi:lambda family phage portal protein
MVRVIDDNVVGIGIVPRFESAELAALWQQWAESTQCDASGRLNFYGIQSQVCKAVVTSGGCLVRARVRRPGDGFAVPFRLEVLEDDYLDSLKNERLVTGGQIIQGVEVSPLGEVVAYWIFPAHPGGELTAGQTSFRVPAAECIYIYDSTERPGARRGVSWIAAAILTLRDIGEMDDAVINQAKVAACFGALITREADGDRDDGAELDASGHERITPAMIERLDFGEDVKTLTPPTFQGYKDYIWLALHKACAAVGTPYELVFGDLMNVNFSSGRLGFTEFARRVERWQYQLFIPALCEPVGRWFLQFAALAGEPAARRAKPPAWTAPRRQMLDPANDTAAVKDQVRAGLLPPLEALRQQGYSDPEAVLRQYAADWALIDKLGLVFDTDSRRVSAPGGGNLTSPPSNDTTTKTNTKATE